MISHSSYPRCDLTDTPHLTFCFLAKRRASTLAACHGEARLDYGLAIEPEDEPVRSTLIRLHLPEILRVLAHADNHLAPALNIQLAEQVVDMQLRCR